MVAVRICFACRLAPCVAQLRGGYRLLYRGHSGSLGVLTGGIADFLETQRDTYKYIHDQTLRLAYKGYTPHLAR